MTNTKYSEKAQWYIDRGKWVPCSVELPPLMEAVQIKNLAESPSLEDEFHRYTGKGPDGEDLWDFFQPRADAGGYIEYYWAPLNGCSFRKPPDGWFPIQEPRGEVEVLHEKYMFIESLRRGEEEARQAQKDG